MLRVTRPQRREVGILRLAMIQRTLVWRSCSLLEEHVGRDEDDLARGTVQRTRGALSVAADQRASVLEEDHAVATDALRYLRASGRGPLASVVRHGPQRPVVVATEPVGPSRELGNGRALGERLAIEPVRDVLPGRIQGSGRLHGVEHVLDEQGRVNGLITRNRVLADEHPAAAGLFRRRKHEEVTLPVTRHPERPVRPPRHGLPAVEVCLARVAGEDTY